jgi:hypothetical protein
MFHGPCQRYRSLGERLTTETRRYDRAVREVHRVPENAGVLRYLAQGADPGAVVVEAPPAEVNRWRLGAHPDVVDWLWDELNAAIPGDGRRLVAATAALVDPASGLIVAIALGTQYAIRLAGDALAEAEAAGFTSVHHFRTVDRTLDLAATYGPGWVFGKMDAREKDWLARSLTGIAG